MAPYTPGRPIEEVQRELGLSEVIKLASNENPIGASPDAIAAAQRACLTGHLYPDAASFQLKEALSSHLGLPPNQILVGSGSDQLISLISEIYLGSPDDEIVMGEPSFVRYESAAKLVPCKVIKVEVTENLELDLDQMVERFSPRTKIVWLANPNNPTGTIFRKAALDRLLEHLPIGATVVLDEAYHEFAEHVAEYPKGLDYVRSGAPVICLRTFSKAYGLAGFRVGYGYAASSVVDAINRIREPFNVSSISQAAAVAALGDIDHLVRSVRHNASMLERLARSLEAVGAKPYASFANFILADVGMSGDTVFQALLREGVIVRSGGVLGLPNAIRVSVGTESEMGRFDEALKKVMSDLRASV